VLNKALSARFELAIFDYDGVLVDSLSEAISAGCAYCRSVNHDRFPTESVIRSLENMTYTELGRAIGLGEKNAERYSLYTFDRFKTMGAAMAFYPGIEKLLRSLTIQRMAIVSGNARDVIEQKLSDHALLDKIGFILGATEPGDKAEKINRARRFFDVATDRTCMIGDSTSDIRHAKKAGVVSIATTWGWHSREKLAGEHPDYIADSVQDLAALLDANRI